MFFRTSFQSLYSIAWVVVRGARGEEWEGGLGEGQGGDKERIMDSFNFCLPDPDLLVETNAGCKKLMNSKKIFL